MKIFKKLQDHPEYILIMGIILIALIFISSRIYLKTIEADLELKYPRINSIDDMIESEYSDSYQYARELIKSRDSIARKDSIKFANICNKPLPKDIELMVNALGEITLKKGSKYIEKDYEGVDVIAYYKWGYSKVWFKDTCQAKKAYVELLQSQINHRKADSIANLRNTIMKLK